MIYNKFKNLKNDLIGYFDNNQSIYNYSQIKARNYIWISDLERYFDDIVAHFEIIVENDIVSVDLHFENKRYNQELIDLLILKLPSNISEKKWSGKAITHNKKFDLQNDIDLEEIIECLNELYQFAYPILISRLKEIFPEKSQHYINMADKIELLKYKKQIILQGPPGTGKTRLAKEIALEMIGNNGEIDLKNYLKKGISIPNASGTQDYYFLENVTANSVELSSERATKRWSASFKKIQEKLSQLQRGESPKNKGGDDPYVLAVAKYVFENFKNSSDTLENNDQFKLIQFHPSYTYEDFVRGIVAESNGDKIEYKNVNKTLGLFAEKALNNLIDSKKDSKIISKEIRIKNAFEDFKEFINDEIEKSAGFFSLTESVGLITTDDNEAFRYKGQNEGWLKNGNRMLYKDILQAYSDGNTDRQHLKKNLHISGLARQHASYFVRVLNLFQEFIKKEKIVIESESNDDKIELKNFVLVIDEINRANLSSVLGELIYALEYREKAVESMYSVEDSILDNKNQIILPPNLYIIGTMNTADRSVGHIDYAIRRRFAFVEILPEALTDNDDIYFNLNGFDAVAALFNRENVSNEFEIKDVQIGHSYFIAKKSEAKNETERDEIFKMKMQYEVVPILEEYVKDGILINDFDGKPIKEYISTLKPQLK